MKASHMCRYLQSHAHPPRLAVPNENSSHFSKGNHSHHLHTGVRTHCETTLSGREPMSTGVKHSSNKNNQHSQDTDRNHVTTMMKKKMTKTSLIGVILLYFEIIFIIYISLNFDLIYYSVYMTI